MNSKFSIFKTIVLILYSTDSFAYIDPGSTSIILQILAAFFAGLIATFKLWVYTFKSFISKIVSKFQNKKNKKKTN